MARGIAVPIVRCRLEGAGEAASSIRYVPLVEFELWRHFMETRHGRAVTVETVSVWVPENAWLREAGYAVEELEPVLRVHLDLVGPHGVPVPVERFLPAETYPEARDALLAHFQRRRLWRGMTATPGYVVPARARSGEKTVA
jgi:hypothetical protein